MKPLQKTLDVISRWSSRYGINVSISKSVGVLFFKDPRGWSGANMVLTYRDSPIVEEVWQSSGDSHRQHNWFHATLQRGHRQS